MSQNHLEDSGVQSSKTPGLKPVLAAALASLEVQLDQELTRYRRTRLAAYRTLNQPRMRASMSNQAQKLAAAATVVTTQPSPIAESVNEISSPQVSSIIQSTPVADIHEELPKPVKENLPRQHTLQISSTSATDEKPALPTLNSANIVPAAIAENKSEDIVKPQATPKPPEDYLESSEALLRSLAQEPPQTTKTRTSGDSLLSPIGIGSMLLLLLSSLTLGYVMFNPKNLPRFSFNNLFQRNASNSEVKTENVSSNTKIQTQAPLTPIPKYPNLATNEFTEVKTPDDVVGLAPTATPILISTPNPVVTPNSAVSPTTAAQPPQLPIATPSPEITPTTAAQVQQPTATTSPSAQPTPTPQKLDDAEIKPLADGFYHVVVDNQGENSLAKARLAVPDAYLSPEKKFIYLGAFKTKEQVKQHLQMLETKGIKARVQQP
ncbi:hypothetical protein ACF3DV_15375 [Chlorogloeopsis fritschii PCC 9212]|uniref:SPOR domain-containing protein n=1 Tax=Chlorogloeopsis fritschii PCC 6912 TaxID=211165 RepID=A0A3S5K285_CHLFR|nr:hypothetical protein [Chlorogloeopsis fritschii]RUR83437.1 hypothetical protein PCC6912_22700 [Chlorogloeopsis fritschii PCC 6912]